MPDYTDPNVYGVVVAVYARTTDRFLLLTERYDKPAVCKLAGMHTFVCETVEPSDGSVLATMRRAVSEEVGLHRVTNDDIFLREQPLVDLPHGFRVYVGWVVVEEEFIPEHFDQDVCFHGWFSVAAIRACAEIKNALRIETIPALEIVLRARGGVDV